MATYMVGMLEQWQREDAELFRRRQEAAAAADNTAESNPRDQSKTNLVVDEDDDDSDFEDCEDEENFEGQGGLELDDDEELLGECEISPKDFNSAFIRAMNDHKKAYPQGWQQMFEEFKQCMQKTQKPFKAWELF